MYLRFSHAASHIDEFLNSVVSLLVSRFDFAGRFRGLLRAVVEQAVGPRPTDALVEENEQGRHPDAFGGESVTVGSAGALPQTVGFHLAQVVALGEGIGLGREAEGTENRFMDRGGSPAVELRTAVPRHLHQADHPRVLDLDSGNLGFGDGNRGSPTLEQREVDLKVEQLSCKAGQTIRRGHPLLTEGRQILQSLVQAEILHPMDADL